MTKTQIRDYYPDIYLKLLTLESKHDCDMFYHKKLSKDKVKICLRNYYKYERDLNAILKEITNRNRINATLEKLFERTLHLNELIGCKIHYKDGKVINCSQIQSTIEYFDGMNSFGKCFIYFDKRKEHQNNRSQNIFNSDNSIEFIIDSINLRQNI